MDHDLSLLPSGGRNAGSRLPSTATVKVIVVCAILLALALAARWQLTGQLKDQQSQLASAEASQQQLKLRSERIRNQLGELQTAGGASRLELVKGLSDSRTDWQAVILAIARNSSPGLRIASMAGTSSAQASGSSDVAAASTVQISGTAASRAQLQAFVSRLRKEDKVFVDVQLNKASSAPEAAPTDGVAPKASTSTEWALDLTLVPVAPLPTNAPVAGAAE